MNDDLRQVCGSVTPESVRDLYELHFVEFDDQGWLFPNTAASADALATNPSNQIDNLMDRLTFLLAKKGEDLSIVVFVHGWKHNAQANDVNVREFRALLEAAGAEERDRAGPAGKPRKVVGVYVAWRGKSWTVPDPLLSLTFWARKEAARRVSIGSSRELFARLRSLRTHYNHALQTGAASEKAGARPRIRTLMIGHSFGGLILYAAMSGSLIESLAAQRDLDGAGKGTELAERPADMILLINPAFEASRYEALYRVSLRYKPTRFQPPLLVSVTSIKDWATGIAFPIGRSVNTLFERETTSEQGTAMKKTPGHIDHYLTHRLYAHAPGEVPGADNATPGDSARCAGWRSEAELKDLHGEELGKAVRQNKKLEAEDAAEFFRQNLTPGYLLKPNWTRTFCGGSFLTTVVGADESAVANAMIWNVEVDGDVIKNHDDVMNPMFRAFMRQLYGDVSAHP
ncbi:hypothetical protein LMG23992_01347 [Cupriavidus laharis]|uniref:Alpha/beta hydrolase n=2 Tax=Cupriavidus laharis TaxID=151654 RepID=A0ABN7Y840_9BURK|nr:hypothetical protein LMG23992_01347 [Cupriavidus laharis]